MATGVVSWSQTAASNGTADSTVNMAEGMAPSAVNDGVRAAMASVAKYRDDLNGSITTTGTSTAYSLTSNQGLALTAGHSVCFCPNVTNGATVTLNVDSLGVKPLRSAPGVELPAGVLIQGTPYVATYFTSNSGEWILHDFYGNPYSVPIGGMMPYFSTTAPNSSFVLPYGQAISRSTYSTFFGMIGTVFGSGDGSTTFNVPDLRGRAIFGLDNMGGSTAGRLTSTTIGGGATGLGQTGGAETVTLTVSQMPLHGHTGTTDGESGDHSHTFSGTTSGQSADHSHGLSNGSFLILVGGQTHGQGTGSDMGSAATTGGTSSDHTHTFSGTTSGRSADHTHTFTTGSEGLNFPHPNMPPAMVLPFILRVI